MSLRLREIQVFRKPSLLYEEKALPRSARLVRVKKGSPRSAYDCSLSEESSLKRGILSKPYIIENLKVEGDKRGETRKELWATPGVHLRRRGSINGGGTQPRLNKKREGSPRGKKEGGGKGIRAQQSRRVVIKGGLVNGSEHQGKAENRG